MKQLLFFLFVCILQSCVSKQYLKKHGFSSDIKSLVEETYAIENNQKKLIQTKKLHFTKNGRVKSSKTTDNLGNVIEQTEKRLWFENVLIQINSLITVKHAGNQNNENVLVVTPKNSTSKMKSLCIILKMG